MKAQPNQIKRRPRKTINPKFSGGGIEFSILLRRLSKMEYVKALDLANDKIVEYVTGVGEIGEQGYRPPSFLPPIDGEPVFVSDTTCQVASILFVAQTALDEDRYTWEDIVSFMVDDDILDQMSSAVISLKELGEDEDPKSLTPSQEALPLLLVPNQPETIQS